MKVPQDPQLLPFWNARATRTSRDSAPRRPGAPVDLVDHIVARGEGPESSAELELLRLWFSPCPPHARLAQALRDAGSTEVQAPLAVRAVVYRAQLVERGRSADPGAAHELLGRSIREARAFLESYEVSVAQVGDSVEATAWERPPFRNTLDELVLSAARFAREVARGALEQGLVVRAAIASDQGAEFVDAIGRTAVASPASQRAEALAGSLQGVAIAFEELEPALSARIAARLPGWQAQSPSLFTFSK
jgi:hypothetical protein